MYISDCLHAVEPHKQGCERADLSLTDGWTDTQQ